MMSIRVRVFAARAVVSAQWMDGIKMNKQGNKTGWSGSTPSDAIMMAVEMGADTIFLLTDDEPQISEIVNKERVRDDDHANKLYNFVNSVETTYGRSVKIHPIVYKASSRAGERSKKYWRQIARASGGKLKVIE